MEHLASLSEMTWVGQNERKYEEAHKNWGFNGNFDPESGGESATASSATVFISRPA